jgi:DNA-binding response OmpR family regulator
MQSNEQQPTWFILLIEDDEEDYFLTKSYLKDMRGHSIELDWVSSYNEGLEHIASQAYDIVLVDYNLGDHNGLTSRVRRDSAVICCPSSC